MDKLKSDRLWALIAYVALVVANAKLHLGIDEKTMTEICYVAGAFILGKSLRGTTTGSMLSALVPGVPGTLLEAVVDKGKGKKKKPIEKVVAAASTAKDVLDAIPDDTKDDIMDGAKKVGAKVLDGLKNKPPKRDDGVSGR